ncbi:MAG: hypothetical protein ABIS39_05610 [Sphingomicrobium sp.]
MRRVTMTLVAAGAAIAFAAPASAQYYPAPTYGQAGYGYQQPGYGYQQPGYANQGNWLFNFRDQRYVRMMQDRVQRIRHDIRQMGAMRILSYREVRDLDRDARLIQDRINRYARFGVGPNEARKIDNRVRRLEMRVMREANDWNRRPGTRRYNPWNYDQYQNYYGRDGGDWRDRDSDGRHDRYEDNHDRDDDRDDDDRDDRD